MENLKQKIAVINIDANTENTMKQKLLDGFVIQSITSLLPTYAKLLIVYCTPEEI